MRLFLLLYACFFGQAMATYYEHEASLRSLLFTTNAPDYKIRPAQTVGVSVNFSLLNINQLDIKSQSLVLTGWFEMTWTDPRLVWTPSSFGDIKEVFDTEYVIWRPEVIVGNSISNVGVIEDDKLLIKVTYDGTVRWEPPGVYETHCDVDITYYPFDTQTCVVQLATWGYGTSEVITDVASDTVNLDDFENNGEWHLVETYTQRVIVPDGSQSFSVLNFVIRVRRKPLFYVLNIIVPIVVMSLLSVLVFLVPVESGEKVTYALTVLLSYAVLMTIVSDNMPATSKNVSVLSIYLVVILLTSALTTLLSVLVLQLHHQPPLSSKKPRWLMSLAQGCLARVAGSTPRIIHTGRSIPGPRPSQPRSGKVSAMLHVLECDAEEHASNLSAGGATQERAGDLKDGQVGQVQAGNDLKVADGDNSCTWEQLATIVNDASYRVFVALVLGFTGLFVVALLAGGDTR